MNTRRAKTWSLAGWIIAVGLAVALWTTASYGPVRFAQRQHALSEILIQLADELRQTAEQQGGRLPASKEVFLAHSDAIHVSLPPDFVRSLRYHRAADQYHEVPSAALLFSIAHTNTN